MFSALYLYILNGLHLACTDCFKEACTVCKARHLVARALHPYAERVSRKCEVCGDNVKLKELLLAEYVIQYTQVEDGQIKQVLMHNRNHSDCWIKHLD